MLSAFVRYDSELGYDGEYDEPSMYCFDDNVVIGSDSEDDDDDVLEMRTASSRSRSNSASSIRKPGLTTPFRPGSATSTRPRPPTVRRHSTDREHVTIAPIAPTMLKSTGVGNELVSLPEGKALESPKDVDLVYVPTSNHYGVPGSNGGEVYHHRESYFSVGTTSPYPRSPQPRSPAPGSSPQIPDAMMPPEQQPPMTLVRQSGSGSSPIVSAQSMVDSPMQLDDTPLEDAYDYFGGPDLGEDFSHGYGRVHAHRRRQRRDVRDEDAITRYAEGGAASVTNGRSTQRAWGTSPSPSPVDSPRTPDAEMPVVVVNEVSGAVEERQERSRARCPLPAAISYRIYEQQEQRDASPTAAVPVPVSRVSPTHAHLAPSIPNCNPPLSSSNPVSGLCTDSDLLSPSDVVPVRGRQPHPHSPSVSGSTTTGSSSYHSSDSRSASSSRGRSSTRTSSFSDRERSGSRSRSCSRGTSSPIGSISPTGSAIGIVNGGAFAGVRCRDGRDRRRRGNGAEDSRERGRDRTGRRLGDSLSPPGQESESSSSSPVFKEATLEKQPMLNHNRAPSPPSSVSGSSTETASVSTVGPSAYQQAQESAERPRLSIHAPSAKPPAVPVPVVRSPIPELEEEEELRRSSHPTPANSPVAAFRIAVLPAQTAQPVSSPISASHDHPSISTTRPNPKGTDDLSESPTSLTATSSSRHPSRGQRRSLDGVQEHAGTLVNRAAEIVQTAARGLLGSIWSSNGNAASA